MAAVDISEMWPSIFFSIRVALTTTFILTPISILLAKWIAARKPFTQSICETGLMLPLTLPPVATGYILLILFGVDGIFGHFFSAAGYSIPFTFAAAVIATSVMALPFYVQSILVALKSKSKEHEISAASLGAYGPQIFFQVTLPLIWPGIVTGAGLAFVRSVGEFGATMVLAGNIPGRTQTLSGSIWMSLQVPGGETQVWALLIVSVAMSMVAAFMQLWFIRYAS